MEDGGFDFSADFGGCDFGGVDFGGGDFGGGDFGGDSGGGFKLPSVDLQMDLNIDTGGQQDPGNSQLSRILFGQNQRQAQQTPAPSPAVRGGYAQQQVLTASAPPAYVQQPVVNTVVTAPAGPAGGYVQQHSAPPRPTYSPQQVGYTAGVPNLAYSSGPNPPVVVQTVPAPQTVVRSNQVAPEDHLVYSLLVFFFCWGIFGLVALNYSFQVQSRVRARDLAGAQIASMNAKKWAKVGLIVGIIIWLIVVIASIIARAS